MNNSLDVYHVLGVALNLSADVATKFPEQFADVVARWEPDNMDAIIEALTEKKEDKANGR